MVIAVVDDLLFSSKIRAVAQATGARVTFARSRDAAIAAAGQAPALVIFDLDPRTGDVIETIRLMREACGPATRMIGFGAHVNVDHLQAAREAGCDEAIPRSAFVVALPDLLAAQAAQAH